MLENGGLGTAPAWPWCPIRRLRADRHHDRAFDWRLPV